MSILFREQPRPIEARSTGTNYRGPFNAAEMAMGGSSGVHVDADSAMRHDAWWSCITAISQDIAMMPVDVHRSNKEGALIEIDPPQIFTAPSVFHGALDWRYQVIQSWLSCGNAWGIVTKTTQDFRYPTRIELKNDTQVIRWMVGNVPHFSVEGQEEFLWPAGRLWHAPAYTVAGYMLGLSPVQYHAWTIGKGLAAAKHGLQYFTDGATPVGIWNLSGDPNDKVVKGFKARVMALVQGSREPLFIGKETAEYKPIQSNPTDSQFIETERYSVEQICRIFREDVADHSASAGAGGTVTYANRSDADLARYKRRQFWVTKFEQLLTTLVPGPQTVKLNTSASLRMTEMEKHELFQLRLNSKTITVNEVRVIIDEKPFDDPEYDKPGVPGGMTPIAPTPSTGLPNTTTPPAKAAPKAKAGTK